MILFAVAKTEGCTFIFLKCFLILFQRTPIIHVIIPCINVFL